MNIILASLVIFAFFALAAATSGRFPSPQWIDVGDNNDGVSQLHMAQGGDSSSMTLSWATDFKGGELQANVRIGLSAESLAVVSADMLGATDIRQYNYNDPDGRGTYESPFLYHATLVHLEPSTQYFYQVGDFVAGVTSGVHSFTTLPKTGDLSEPLKLGVIGDLGTTVDSAKTIGHMMMNSELKMVLHVGDLSYANCDQPKWDKYGRLTEMLASSLPWMVGSGNHEIEISRDGPKYLAYEERYRMPRVKPPVFGEITHPATVTSCTPSVFQSEYDFGNSFYSFDTAGVHVINLNPYSVTNATSPQMAWLLDDLSTVDRSITPWVIVMMHCPWYNSNKAHYEEWQTVTMRESMEEVLYEHGVNMVLSGHVHALERSFPTYRAQPEGAKGITFLNIGDAGNAEGHAENYYDQPGWSAFRNGTQYGHGEVTLVNATHAQWQWVRNVDGEAVFADSVWICNSVKGMRSDCQ